jgi:multicomponent Na+:H+ antiporter subunit D
MTGAVPFVTWEALPLAVVLSSLLPGIGIMLMGEERRRARTLLNLTGSVAKLLFVGLLLQGVAAGAEYAWALEILPGLALTLRADALALLFVTLSAVLWLLTTIYAIGYLEGGENRRRFFSFFSLCVTATTGIAMAGDLFTFVLFFEALTWATYPLVVHLGTPKAVEAGRRYLVYTLVSGAVLVLGAVWFQVETGGVAFAPGGVVDPEAAAAAPARYLTLFLVLLAGLSVKAALIPVHGWLPVAMVAPAPVSALLHAVAVVKAGAFGVTRLLHSLFGIEVSWAIGGAGVVVVLAALTILYGSLRALAQDDLKRLLAFSTVSQLSYIALGVAILAPMAQVGGLVHLVHQGIQKIVLFFCAGLLAQTLGVKKISQMGGVARRMPLTLAAFSVAALGMIGIPPVAGFLSKWYLGVGAFQGGMPWVAGVLLASSLLNAAYFLPVIRTAYLDDPDEAWSKDAPPRGRWEAEADLRLLLPAVIVAIFCLLAGVFGGAAWSPLAWTELIVGRGDLW